MASNLLTSEPETEATESKASATDALLKQHGESFTEQDLQKTEGSKEEMAA